MIAWPLIGFNDALDGFNHRRLWDARIGESCVNLGQMVRLDCRISRALSLNQKPAHPAVATQKTNSLPMVRQIDCGCRMAKKLKLQESRVVISSERGLAAHRRLRFFERSVVPIVDRRANGGRRTEWARILAYITGTVDQELLLRNEYLAAENRILRGQLKGRLKFSDAERAKLGEIGRRLGRKALGEVATAALPDTILAWYRRLVARKFDGSQARRTPGRPRIDREVEQLIVRMAEENRSWGYDRIVGALAKIGA